MYTDYMTVLYAFTTIWTYSIYVFMCNDNKANFLLGGIGLVVSLPVVGGGGQTHIPLRVCRI